MKSSLVVLFDVDNTLLDDDRIVAELCDFLLDTLGEEGAKKYWKHFEALRHSLGYADYLGALQRARDEDPHEMHFLAISNFLVNYPFAERVHSRALDVIDHVARWGLPTIVSDGDVVFQPIKLYRAGLARAVQDRVLVYIHKEKELDDIMGRYPSPHYVLVDDTLSILTAVKQEWGPRVTTIHVRPTAHGPDNDPKAVSPDMRLNDIGEMLNINKADLRGASHATSAL
jgi:FMN phosphatase YigB (HAD superfamily)